MARPREIDTSLDTWNAATPSNGKGRLHREAAAVSTSPLARKEARQQQQRSPTRSPSMTRSLAPTLRPLGKLSPAGSPSLSPSRGRPREASRSPSRSPSKGVSKGVSGGREGVPRKEEMIHARRQLKKRIVKGEHMQDEREVRYHKMLGLLAGQGGLGNVPPGPMFPAINDPNTSFHRSPYTQKGHKAVRGAGGKHSRRNGSSKKQRSKTSIEKLPAAGGAYPVKKRIQEPQRARSERRVAFSLDESHKDSPPQAGSNLGGAEWKSQLSDIRKQAQGDKLDLAAMMARRQEMDTIMRRQVATHPVAAAPAGRLAPLAPSIGSSQYAHQTNPASPLGEPAMPLGQKHDPLGGGPAPRDNYLDGFNNRNGHSRPGNAPPNFNQMASNGLLGARGLHPTGGSMRHEMSIVEKEPELAAIKRQMDPKLSPTQLGSPVAPVIFTHMLPRHDGTQLKEPTALSPMQHTFDSQTRPAPAPYVAPPEHSNEYLDGKATHARKLAAKLRSMGAGDEAAELEQMAVALDKKKR